MSSSAAGRPGRNRLLTSTSDAVLERLQGLYPKAIDLSLDRVEALLHRLGDPQDSLAPVVHVAGTNGKGSVIAFLRAFLEAAGFRVHAFTSPHLLRFSERIRVAGETIGEAALTDLLEECETVNQGDPITFFEITAAVALLAFTRAPADVVLLETGLGGRLDATNVIARPALTVLTPVSIDHQHYLGDSLEEIASEKAGILKPGVACVAAAQEPAAAGVIAERARAVGAPLLAEGEAWSARGEAGHLVFRGLGGARTLPAPALAGAHQVRNAGQAIACAEALAGLPVSEAALAQGLVGVRWPGRLQRLEDGVLAQALPEGWELWLDGGHNAAAARALAAHAENWGDRPLHLVLGMMRNKDPRGFLAPLAAHAAGVHAVAVPGEAGSLAAADVAAAARALGLEAASASGIADALAAIAGGADDASGPARVLITGSLYLVGAALRENA